MTQYSTMTGLPRALKRRVGVWKSILLVVVSAACGKLELITNGSSPQVNTHLDNLFTKQLCIRLGGKQLATWHVIWRWTWQLSAHNKPLNLCQCFHDGV